MSDRPTLWVFEVLDGEHDGVIYVNYTMPREATRADLLAALGAKRDKWDADLTEEPDGKTYEVWLVPVEVTDE